MYTPDSWKKIWLFQDAFQKISQLAYMMQFSMLFLMMYLEVKFDPAVVEKNDIYWIHAAKMSGL